MTFSNANEAAAAANAKMQAALAERRLEMWTYERVSRGEYRLVCTYNEASK